MDTAQAVRVLSEILKQMADGKQLTVPGMPYPLAMAEDGTVGFLYAGGVVDSFDVKSLVKLIKKHDIRPL